MPVTSTDKVKYVTDEKGKRQEVIISFNVWKDMVGELEMIREKNRILTGLKKACNDLKKQEKGELPEQDMESFLNEL